MKKLILTASALVLGLSLAMPAMADCNGVYVAGRGGVVKNFFKKKQTHYHEWDGLDKTKLMISGAVGYRYNFWRTELEYVWRDKSERSNEFFRRDFKTYSGMWNNYIDIFPYEWISPYVGAGIGFTKMRFTSYDKAEGIHLRNDDRRNFTWSLGGGLTVKVTNRINVDAGYRYYDVGSFGHEDVSLQEVYGGLRYVF